MRMTITITTTISKLSWWCQQGDVYMHMFMFILLSETVFFSRVLVVMSTNIVCIYYEVYIDVGGDDGSDIDGAIQ